MGSKRKLSKVINDTLEVDEYFDDVTAGGSGAAAVTLNPTIRTLVQLEPKSQLSQSFSLGLSSTTAHHFPDLSLGNAKYVSACFNQTPGKSVFCFRNGRELENNQNMIKLSEGGLDIFLSRAPVYIQYLDKWAELKKRCDEDKKFLVSEKHFPELPSPVVLEDDGVNQVVMNVFKYKEALGGGVSLRIVQAGESNVKPFGMTSETFKQFISTHVPFFRKVYSEFGKMIENVCNREGITNVKTAQIVSWKNA